MKVLVAYFSATGNTARMAEVIKRELAGLGAEAELLDITSYADRQKPLGLKPYRAAVFGFPVHANRAPRITRDWLDNLDGNGMPCATYYTYGGFRIHPSHHWGKLILGRRNFDLVASAEFPGAHTYNHSGWRAMDAESGEADRDRCILCLRCLADCPEEALSITDLSQAWQMKLERENETAEGLGLKKSRIYL